MISDPEYEKDPAEQSSEQKASCCDRGMLETERQHARVEDFYPCRAV